MNENYDLLNRFPEETKNTINQIWQVLPDSEKNQLSKLADQIPTQTNLWKLLVRLSSQQVKIALGQKHRVVIVGPANVGKSTLFNQFVQIKDDQAEVSPIPGTTRENQEAGTGVFTIVDTPGADAVGTVGEDEKQKALDACFEADFLIIIFDALQGIKKTELDLYKTLVALRKPFIVVLNKIDLVQRDLPKIINKVADNLQIKPEQIIPISAKTAKNLSNVLTSIAIAEPSIMAALGSALPQYRWQLSWRVIVSSASLSGVIALTPLPIIDFIPLVANQVSMVLGIARIHNFKLDYHRARELVVTFGLGFLGRTLFYELSKFGGIPGWLLSAAIAASTTVAMGYASVVWFANGEKLSSEQLKELVKSVTALLLNSLKNSRNKKDRKKLQEEIELTLKSSDLGAEQGKIEDLA